MTLCNQLLLLLCEVIPVYFLLVSIISRQVCSVSLSHSRATLSWPHHRLLSTGSRQANSCIFSSAFQTQVVPNEASALILALTSSSLADRVSKERRNERIFPRRAHSVTASSFEGSNSKPQPIPQPTLSQEEKTSIRKKLNRSFFEIAIPAFIQLTAEPLASLVDTAYLGRLGPEVLGGAGVAINAQYAVSKLYNDPLLRTSISLVASQDGKAINAAASETESTNDIAAVEGQQCNNTQLSVAVSSAILLAFVIGFVQLIIYSVLAESIIQGMGVTDASPMWSHAVSYLKIRALGTPAATLWLVSNGIFRGLGDTKTPLVYSLLFTGLNAILDPIFIFTLKFGASGAAAGTALAQYIALIPLLLSLNKRTKIDIVGQLPVLRKTLKEYVEAGSFVLIRTVGKVLAYSVCAREAALLGAVAAATYNLTFQLGFATTQICESVAVAVQTLLAREISILDTEKPLTRAYSVKHLIRHSTAVGGTVAFFLSLATYLQQDRVLLGLTNSASVLDCAKSIFPAVLLTQVLKGLAYPVNGIIMGGLDWKFTMLSMWAANVVCVGLLRFGGVVTLNKVWYALAAFMGIQVFTGVLRVQSRTGIWKVLKSKK